MLSYLLLLLGSLLVLSPIASSSNIRLVLKPCRIPDVEGELLCGKLEVPENRAQPNGRRIALNVVVIPSLSPTPAPEPLFFLDGGPGAAATDAAVSFAEELPFRRTHDIVLVDQRGTGNSNPLHCDLVGDVNIPQNFLNEMYPPEAVAACRAELEKRAELSQYTTLQAIADLEAVRRWLGYDRIKLLAISYGTRAAYAYMRQSPDHVHSAILLGMMPVDGKMPFHHAVAAQESIESLFADCRADSLCNRAFPDLETTFAELLRRMQTNPSRTLYTNPVTGDTATVVIAAPIFAEKIRSLLYFADTRAYVPYIIAAAAKGDFRELLNEMIPAEPDTVPGLAEGLYLSLTSAEDIPLIDTAEARTRNEKTYFGNYRVDQQVRAASLWRATPAPDSFYKAAAISTPVLFISGARDPVTPLHLAAQVVKQFPNGRHIVIAPMAHLPDGLEGAECIFTEMLKFIASGAIDQFDTTCVSTLRPPPFYLGE